MPDIRVVVAHRPPFVFVTNSSSGTFYSGLLIDLLNRVLLTSNITYQYSLYISPTNAGGTLGSNGTWSGVIGELVAKRADVALFPLTRTAARLNAIDCTFSYYDAGLSLLVRDGETGPGPLSVLAPFEMTLWVTLLSTVIGVALLFWGLDVYGRWIRSKQFDALRESGVLSEKQVAKAKRDEGNPVLISFMAAAGAPERPGRNSWGVQVLYVVYCFFCLIVLSSYTANLTSYLAVRRAYVGISGLQDLVRDNRLVGVNPGGSTAAYFASSKDSLATQLQGNVRYCDSPTCVSWVRQGIVHAFVTDQPVLLYLSQQQPCDMAVVGDPFGPGNLVLGLQKDSPLLPLFNAAIQSFAEDGTLTSLRRAWFDGLSQCSSAGAQLDSSRLTVNQMLGAFVFLSIGVLVAFVTGTVENLKWCIARAYARSYSEAGLQSMRSFGNNEPRSSMLLTQASRLRAATWRRLSVGLLGLPMPPAPMDMEEARGLEHTTPRTTATTMAAVAVAAFSRASPVPQKQLRLPLPPGSSILPLGGCVAVGRNSDPVMAGSAAAPTLSSTRSRALISEVSATLPLAAVAATERKSSPSYLGSVKSGGTGSSLDASSSCDVLHVQEGPGGGSGGNGITGSLGPVDCGDDVGSGGANGARVGDACGSPLLRLPQMLPVMPFLGASSESVAAGRIGRRESDHSLPGQPSANEPAVSVVAALPSSPRPPPPPPSVPLLPAAASAPLAASVTGYAPSPLRSIRVAPSRSSSTNGSAAVFRDGMEAHNGGGQQRQKQLQWMLQHEIATAAAPALVALRRPSDDGRSNISVLPGETVLTSFSHVSSGGDCGDHDVADVVRAGGGGGDGARGSGGG